MAEITITGWLDPAMKYFADQAMIPVSDYSAQVGSEGIANGLEMAADFVTKGWLNKAIQGAAGLIASSYAIWGKDVPTRLRKELLGIGTHELLRITEVKPREVAEVQQSLRSFIASAQRGDWNAALSSVLTTPAEIQALIPGSALQQLPPAAGGPGAEKRYEIKEDRVGVPGGRFEIVDED